MKLQHQKDIGMAALFVAAAIGLGAAATVTKYVGTFVGNGAGLTNIPTAGLSGNYQPASDNLTNWSAVITQSKQPANTALTNLANGNAPSLTNATSTYFHAGTSNSVIIKSPDGGTWILRVLVDGTLSAVTNGSNL